MYQWMNPWFDAFKALMSGNVRQVIAPITSWFSPELEFNFAGNTAIESNVVAGMTTECLVKSELLQMNRMS